MTSLNSALNYNFVYAESARIVAAERGTEESIAAQIKQATANAPYQVGATITAKYQYKVAADGSLVPQQTQITHTAPGEGSDANDGLRRHRNWRDDGRRVSLSDLVNPKPELSPTDEVGLFADAVGAHTAPLNVTPSVGTQGSTSQAEVLDENGETVDAELITGNTPSESETTPSNSSFLSLLAQRAQTAAANLYARNSSIIYSTTPISQIAA